MRFAMVLGDRASDIENQSFSYWPLAGWSDCPGPVLGLKSWLNHITRAYKAGV